MFKKRIVKKVVYRKCCVRCGWFEKRSPLQPRKDSCPECRGELLFQKGVVTIQTNALFFWRELEFKEIKDANPDHWKVPPVWLA